MILKKHAAEKELKILNALDTILQKSKIEGCIDGFAHDIQFELENNKERVLVWRSVPFSLFQGALPEHIRSSWVFGIQEGMKTGAERHPRSRQRMVSYQGSGDLQVWDGKRWISRKLVSDSNESTGKRWISIAPNTWHQAVSSRGIWIVVSFHTVAADELIEERPNSDDPMVMQRRTYLS